MLRQRILALEDEVARLMEAREDAEQRVLDAKAETAEARAAEATSAQAVKQLEARLDEAHGTAAEHDEHAANIEAAMLELQVRHCASSVPACAGLTETQCVSAPQHEAQAAAKRAASQEQTMASLRDQVALCTQRAPV